jgi:uncharacterized protein YjbJ (UPF0337 family)
LAAGATSSGKIQERYGIAKDQVRKDIDDWYGEQRW